MVRLSMSGTPFLTVGLLVLAVRSDRLRRSSTKNGPSSSAGLRIQPPAVTVPAVELAEVGVPPLQLAAAAAPNMPNASRLLNFRRTQSIGDIDSDELSAISYQLS